MSRNLVWAGCVGLVIALVVTIIGLLVPSAGLEPALPKEPDFESGASTSSARRADLED